MCTITVNNITSQTKFIIIACDGIWDCLENQMAVDFISEKLKTEIEYYKETKIPLKPSKILEQLFDHILSPTPDIWPNGTDNMAAVLLVFKSTDTP